MKISLYDRPPVLDTEGAFDDSDLLQRFEQRAMEFNRPGGFVDALRKGTAGFLRSFVAPNNIEADRLTALIGNEQERLNDPIGREMSQAQWDAHMRENVQSAANPNFLGLRSLADYIEPTPHAEPDGLLGKAAYKAGEYIPGIAGSVAEFMTLGPLGTILLNTGLGGQAAQQQVYENQLAQGKSTQEARDIAEEFMGNAADLAVRGGTNLATLWALGRAYPGFQSGISPVGHTLRNIGLASGISGAGAMGEEALTNYRSDKDNNLGNLAETGATSAATTGIIGLTLAGLRAKKLIEAQREYNAYQGLHNVEWRDITPPDAPDEPLGLGGSNNPQPPNNPPQSPNGTLALPQGTLQLPEFTTRNIAARLNKAVTQRGFNPITNDFQPNALARQIAAYVGNGYMSMDDALSMLQEGGLSPDDAKGFLNTGIAEILERTRVPETPKQPTEIIIDRIANHPDTQSYRRAYEDYANLDETYSDFGGDNSNPLQDLPDTFTYSPITNPYPTPADFLADIKAKKRQAQSQIRRMEKDFPPQTTDITEQDKEKEYTSAERKIDKSQARVQDANEQFSSIKQPSEKKSIFQNLRVLLERNDMYQGGNLSGKKKQQPTPEQTEQSSRIMALGTNEAFYDDEQADNSMYVNHAQEQDIPDDHSPDTQQDMPKITALGFQPNINKPGASHLIPDLQNATSSKFSTNIDKPNVSHFKPDMQDVTASRFSPNVDKPAISHVSPELQKPNVVRGLDGLEDILQPPQRLTALGGQPQETQQKPNPDITFDEALRKVAEIIYQQHSQKPYEAYSVKPVWDFSNDLPEPVKTQVGEYIFNNRIMVNNRSTVDGYPEYFIGDLQALKDILKTNSPTGKQSDEQNTTPQAPTLTALNETQQPKPESGGIAENLKNIVKNNPTQKTKTKLQPVGKPFIDTEDELGRVKQVTNPEAVKIRDSNLQLLNDAENDEERIRLLNTLTHQQLKDMHDSGAFGVNYYQGQTKKDYIDSIIERRNRRIDELRREEEIKKKREQATARTPEHAPAIDDSDYPFNLEDSYQGMPKQELQAAADKNNSLISSIKDEDTLRKRLSGLHVPMLRAMSGISGSGYKKENFINEIVRVATRPIPDNATLKAGEFSVPGVNGMWTVNPNKAGNSFTIDNDDIPHSSMVYDTKGNYFLSHGLLDRDTTGAVQDYFRQHIKDFYEAGENTEHEDITPQPEPVKKAKPALSPIHNYTSDESRSAAENNLQMLRNADEKERIRLLGTLDKGQLMNFAQAMKHHGLGDIGGVANGITRIKQNFLRFLNKPVQDNKPVTPQAETTETQTLEKRPTTLTPPGNWFATLINGEIVKPDRAKSVQLSKENLDILRNATDNDERRKLLNTLTREQLMQMRDFLAFYPPHIKLPGDGERKSDLINSFIQLIENEKNPDSAQPQTPVPTPVSDNISSVRVVSFNDKHENEKQPEQPHENTRNDVRDENLIDFFNLIEENADMTTQEMDELHYYRYLYNNITSSNEEHTFRDLPEKAKIIMNGFEAKYGNLGTEKGLMWLHTNDLNSVEVHDPHKAAALFAEMSRNHWQDKYDIALAVSKSSDSPVFSLAKKVCDYIDAQLGNQRFGNGLMKPFSNDDLRKWAEQEFGGTIGEGKYDQKQAYDAMEMGINMAIRKHRYIPNDDYPHTFIRIMYVLNDILSVIPTQSNRTPEQVEAQQFSTPPTLAYLVNWLAHINNKNTVLEPSAGTGNLAVFAKNAGANLILNDFSELGLRADILDALGWGKVYREDAMQLGNILAGEVRDGERSENDMPDRVVMNPPFSSAWNLGGNNKNQNGFKHVMSALTALRHGGRLVAILGAGRDGSASSVRKWLNGEYEDVASPKGKYNVRALITVDGKAYKKYGTTFSNAVVVIDKTGATPKGGTAEFAFSGDFNNDEEIRNLFEAMQAIRNDIHDGDNSQPDNDSTPPKPEPPKPAPAPEPAQKTETPSSRSKRIIPEGALLKEGSFTAKGHFHREVMYKVKPAKRDYIHKIADVLEIKSGIEPPFVYIPEYDLFSSGGNSHTGEELKPYVEKAFREHLHEFYELPQKKSDIPDVIKNNPALKAIHDYLDGNTDLTLKVDEAIRASIESNFRYNLQKERQIQEAISLALGSAGFEMDENTRMTRHIYELVRNNQGYDDEHHIIATEKPKKEWEGSTHDRLKQEEATAKTAELVEKVKAAKNEQEIKAILDSVNLHSITGILEGIVGRLYRQASGITSSMNRQQVVERALNTIMDRLHGKPSSEYLLNHLEELSFFSLKEYAKDLGIDIDSLVGTRDDSEPNRAKLRTAIKKALKADTEPETQENQTQQEHIQPENNTQTDTDNNAEAPKKITVSRKSSKELDNERKALREHDEDNSIQSTYTPTIITQGAKHHPADLVESTVMRSVAIPEVSEKPNIPQFIIDEGRLSDAQMEAVTLAVNSFSHILPNGVRRGFFIGDGTGVGKGREISGIIMDTLSRGAGNGKAVWISDKHSLVKDAIRDWQGLGNDPNDICPQERFDAKQTIDRKKGILFTAYSHMATKFRIEQLKKWLGENFDGIIVLDEAHNANHVLGLNAASRAKNTRDFIKAFPKARVLYVSATGAIELDNLAMLDRLGLWGYEYAPFESAQAFVNQVSKGGIAAMEVAARDMKAMGLFVARSLSMRAGPHGGNEDVTFRTLEYTLNDDMVEIYDELVRIWQMIEQNMPAVMKARGYDPKDGKSIGRWKSAFWGAHQRFFNQIITSMQTDSVIRDMRKQLDAGNSVVIQLTNTMEANLNKAIQKGANDDGEYDLSPKDTLIQLVMDLFNPRVVEYVTDDEGNEIVQDVVDSHGKPILSQEVIRMRDNMINTINSINRFPDSPIDKILNFFGHDNVAEITGRSKRPRTVVDKKTGKKSNLETGRTDKVKAGEVEDFNNGKRRILIFSEKGGTGASYHASNDIPNKQKRIHYLLQAGWRADKAIQGLGRSHRSNEAHKPEYVLVTTDIPGQKRFISTIARRLAQLGALSTGERRSTSNGLFSESDNLEAGYVLTALSRFFHNLLAPLDSNYNPYPELTPNDVLKQLGFKQEKLKDVSITDFLNRLLAMSVDLQKKVFARFQQEINTVQEEYQANGIDIDAPTENVKASSINVIQEQRILQSKEFGTDTNYVKLEITRPMNPVTWQDIDTLIKNGVDIEFYTLQSGQIVAAVKASKKGFDPMTSHFYDQYKLIQPDRRKVEYGIRDSVLDNSDPNQKRKFTRIDVKTAQAIWMTQTDELPETYTSTAHLITGAMLPAWGLIEGHPKIWRVTTDDGREFLGRLIPDKQLQKILNALNVKYEGKKYDADSLKKALDKRGMIATLLNKAKLKFSRVNGEKLLEIIPADEWMARSLKRGSAITMIINGKERFFLPKNNDELLNKTLEQYPLVGEPVQIDDADEIIAEGTDIINSSIPDSGHLHIIHPSFWHFINDPDDNPLIHKSKTPMIDPESEERYQKSKVADSSKSAWQHLKDFGSQLWRGRHDIPELANDKGNIDDSMFKAQELLRALKRERQANVHEAEKELRIILLGSSTNDRMSPDDFDLFQRAMELRDLHETRGKDINARMPWGLNPKTLYDFDARDPLDENYDNVMAQVRKNPRVQEAMRIADTLMDDIRKKLVEAADRLGLFDVRDRLKRKHYFRHLVLEYYNMQRSGKPHPTFKNPTARGYMKHREGSDKDISSNWILAMGEVFTRMFDDIKILDTLFKLRKEYDRIEEIKQQALAHNMEHALANIMKDLQDVPDELRKSKAEKKLRVILNTTQARGMTRLFNLAKKGDLPVGNSHEWEELVSRMAEAGQLDNLFQEEQEILSRYIGWLSGLAESSSARKAAKTFLTGIKSRLSALKKTAGNDYVDWKDLIPEGYTIWSPTDSRLVFSASTLPEHLIKIAMENIDTLLEADASDIGKMIQAGGDKQLWVIPENLADALDNIGKSQPIGAFGQFMTKFMGAFKQWVTIGPVNGRIFKYNYRNFFGDLEAVLQGNPGALYYFKQAAEELTKIMFKGGIATGTLAEFQKRGGGLTTEAMTELERPDRIKQFADLYEQKKSMNPLKWGLKAFRAYIDLATTVTNFRESILRYAAFLSYIDLIKENNGVPPFYGLSKPKEVKAVGDNIFDIAFKLANENLGAYDQISANTQWLRDNNFVSFLSWVEVNASRYIRNIASIWTGNSYLEWWIKKHGQKFIDDLIGNSGAGNGNGGNNQPPKGNNGGDFADDDGDNEFRKLFRKLAKKSGVGALRLAITLAMAAPLYFLAKLWNKLMGADDNDPNLNDRNGVSLYLGKNAYTGENLYMPDIGSAWDALRTFGVDNLLAGDVRDLLDGRTSFGQVVMNILDGPISKFVSNANPFGKLIIEGFFGKRAFPSALNPTPIRDKGKFVAQSFGLDWYYDFLTGTPHKPFLDFSSSLVNTANQDQSAYFYMLSRRKQFEENVLGKSVDTFTMTRRGEALRNAKRAADLGDGKSLRKYLREYFRAGGSEQGLKISARTMEPLYGLNDTDEMRFIRWLPKEERKILRRAMRYAERMKAKLGVW